MVNNQKDGQARLLEIVESGFKMFHSLLGCLGVKLVERDNKQYRGRPDKHVAMAKKSPFCARKNGPKDVKMPSGDWLKKIRHIKMEELVPVCNKLIIVCQVRDLRRHRGSGKFKQCVVALDRTKKPH